MGFFTNSLAGIYTWNSNNKFIGEGEVEVYSIHGGGEYLVMSDDIFNKEPSRIFIENEHIINGLLWSKKWSKEVLIISDDDLRNELSKFNIPVLPQEKLDYLFEYIFNMQLKDGQEIRFHEFWRHKYNSNMLFFKDEEECNFYLKALVNKGLIEGKFPSNKGDNKLYAGNVTFDGFDYHNKITNEGLKSKRCFIAMSFGDEMKDTRNSIKSAIGKCGFSPILIDEVHADPEKTINDEIIAQLKKSKFCIADFTEQRDGVYFEAGFALGRGLKVIYTCQEDHFKQSHFDTNHFPHIIYKTPQELEEKLINKIEAWIKD